MKRRRTIIAASIVVVALVAAAVGIGVYVSRPAQGTAYSSASWTIGGAPSVVTVRVIDSGGRSVAGVSVNVVNNSGDNAGVTDSNGVSTINTAEADLARVDVNKIPVVDRSAWYFIGPNVTKGVIVRVTLLDPVRFGLNR